MTFTEATSAQARRTVRVVIRKLVRSGEIFSERVEALWLFLEAGVESEYVQDCFWKEA